MLLAPRSSLTVCLLQKRKKELSDSVEGDGVSCYHPAWTWGECRTSLFGPTCPLTFRHGGPKFVLPLMFSKWKEQIRPWQVWSSPWSVQLLILCLPERSRMSGTLAKFRKNERILPPLPSIHRAKAPIYILVHAPMFCLKVIINIHVLTSCADLKAPFGQ